MTAFSDTPIGQLMNGLVLLFVALSIVSWIGLARIVRGQVLSLKEKEFVEAGQMVGARYGRIMWKHILPNCLTQSSFTQPCGFQGLSLRKLFWVIWDWAFDLRPKQPTSLSPVGAR